MIGTCEACGAEFHTFPSRKSKFCSKQCWTLISGTGVLSRPVCRNGHQRTPETTRINPSGARTCKVCEKGRPPHPKRGICIDCGVPCSRLGGRCHPCAQKGELNSNWQGSVVAGGTGRVRARSVVPSLDLIRCADCGSPSKDRHHSDGNTSNNTPNNIVALCRRCHMRRDGRLDALRAQASRAGAIGAAVANRRFK